MLPSRGKSRVAVSHDDDDDEEVRIFNDESEGDESTMDNEDLAEMLSDGSKNDVEDRAVRDSNCTSNFMNIFFDNYFFGRTQQRPEALKDSQLRDFTKHEMKSRPQMTKKHDVVISGIAGVFPECDDVDELWTKLLAKDSEMVTEDSRRWTPGEMGVPSGTGKIREANKFDMSFFGVSRRLCINMDPLTKLCMEQSFRAVCDAGINPAELSGTNTAVLMASVTSETEYDCVIQVRNIGHAMLGLSRTMQANRTSYFMNLKGPSLMMDSSWCGGIQGIQYAKDLIAEGHITGALVGACSIMFRPEVSTHYQGMGRLSKDSKTRSFSADASGYGRSEGCVVFLLQRKEHARRSYGSIISATCINIGSRTNPIAEVSEEEYRRMLLEIYQKAKISPDDLTYLEASGVASKEVDSRELRAVSDVLLKKRKKPLLVGSIKSSVGHCEGASCMVSAIKTAMVLDRGVIPPNLHYTSPNPNVPALVSGKLQVVTEPTPIIDGDLAACTDFGAAANVAHMVLKRHDKVKKYKCQKGELPPDGLPRLVLMSDRTDSNLIANRERLNDMEIDEELVCLMNHVYKDGIRGHMYRGYTVLNGKANNCMQIDEYKAVETRRPIWFMFSGMGSQWPAMGRSLMRLPVFAEAIHKCHDVLAPKGVSVLDIVTKDDATMFDTILHSFVGIAAVQIGLVNVLKALGIEPDGILGHSVGELGCAYADGCFTAEQMILSAYARGRASVEADLIKGMMAAVGKGYHEMKSKIPESIEVACHNSSTSCTLSGPAADMEKYISFLKKQEIFAKLVNVANIAYHSRYIKPAAPALLRYLKEVIPAPKPRSSKWISSSIPETQWDSELAQLSSAEYHTNNLLSSVLFEEASAHVPPDAVVIEIAPHGLLQAIVRKSMPGAAHIPLTSKFEEDNLMFLLGAIGKMYIQGIPVDIKNLYPPIEFPVSRETPAISPFIGWQHDEEHIVKQFVESSCQKNPGWKEFDVLLQEERYSSLKSHKIRERIVLPPSFYIGHIIDMFAENERSSHEFIIAIDSFDYVQDVEIPESQVQLFSQLHKGSGNFCYFYDQDLVARGILSKLDKFTTAKPIDFPSNTEVFSGDEIVSFMGSMGLNLSGKFKAIEKFAIINHVSTAIIKWNNSITEFLNSVFLLVEFNESKKENTLQRVTQAVKIIVDFSVLKGRTEVVVEYDAVANILNSDCIQVLIPQVTNSALSSSLTKNHNYSIGTHEFVPFINPKVASAEDLVSICSQLVMENLHLPRDKSSLIRVIGIGNDVPLLNTLEKVGLMIKGQQVFSLPSVLTEEEYFQRDSSFIHHDIVWILTTSPSKDLLQSLNSALRGFILTPKNAVADNSVNVISEFVYGDTTFILGTSLPKANSNNYVTIKAEGDYIPILRRELENAAKENWEINQDKNVVVLTGKQESITAMILIMEESDLLPHSDLLRYVFSDDGYSNDECQLQLTKNCRQNMRVKGVWGSYRFLSTEFEGGETFANGRDAKIMYPLSSIVANTGILAVGLNLTDVTSTLKDDDLGVFDYVTSKHVGLAEYDDSQKILKADPILKWNRHPSWTDSEAATVPLLYSLATTILYFRRNTCEMDCSRSLLVTKGMLPLSQAIITLALRDPEVIVEELFVTAGSESEKKQLHSMFPKLRSDNIIDHNKNDIYIQLKRLTKGKGVSKIVSNFAEKDKTIGALKSAQYQFGTLILVSQAPMDGRSKLGLIIFRFEALVVGVNAETLIKSTDQEKIELRDKLQTLIDNGLIKPLNFTTLAPQILNLDAVKSVKDAESKVVVNLGHKEHEEGGSKGKFVCDKSKNYIVICGQRQLDLWLDLVRWLLKRNGRKLMVFLTQTALSAVDNLRLQSLTEQYYGAKINLISMKHISSKTSMARFFSDMESREAIDSIFFVGTDLRGTIQEIDYILRAQKSTCRFVCLGHGGETVCQKRNEDGLQSLCVRCDMEALCSPNILQYLEDLIIKSSTAPVVLLTQHVFSGNRTKTTGTGDSFYLPQTLPELKDLLQLSSKGQPRFVELTTSTARLPYVKEVQPVYFIPGLKPKQTSTLCERMYYPALEAHLPANCKNIEEAAVQLADQILTEKRKQYTVVAIGWGCILALHVGARLEALGNHAKVIFMDGTPEATLKSAAELLRNETTLIDKYLKLSPKVESEVRSKSSWDEKLKTAIELSGFEVDEADKAAAALNFLRNRLLALIKSKPPAQKIRTKCHLIKFDSEVVQTESTGFSDYLTNEFILHLVSGETLEENMKRAAEQVNMHVLFEYSDAAYEISENRIGFNISMNNVIFDN